MMATVAAVKLWGSRIGAVSLDDGGMHAAFEYEPAFIRSGIEVSPLMMPLRPMIYEFPELALQSFHGVPGMLADSLPDKFGNALIDAWLARQGRSPEDFNVVERLCYTGERGMGALEYEPAIQQGLRASKKVRVDALVELATVVLSHRGKMATSFEAGNEQDGLIDILRVGTSAGGARAKAVIAWNAKTNEVRSGQVAAASGFEYWLLKFDGVKNNKDRELADPSGFGAIEYAYSLMARAAGIEMSECRLFEENGRRHFMTKRFDREDGGKKLHMQSLGALAHLDFNIAGAHSYEQALLTIRQLGLPIDAIEEQFRRMAFNIVARNQDDHVKNIAFLMNKAGKWSLSPAFDVSYSYNPGGAWTSQHQMTMNAKRDGFTLDDFRQCAKSASMARGAAEKIVDQVVVAVKRWREFADGAGVATAMRDEIWKNLRLDVAGK